MGKLVIRRALAEFGVPAYCSMMIGDLLRSDIAPLPAMGGWGGPSMAAGHRECRRRQSSRGCRLMAMALRSFGLALAALAGCGQPPVAAPAAADALLAWRGQGACADCAAIRMCLSLQHVRGAPRFTFDETFIEGARAVRFVTRGRWRQRWGVIHLNGDDGDRLSFAMLGDGSLQPLGLDGRTMALPGGGLLVPEQCPAEGEAR